jgi:hypothetical protein
MECLPYDGLSVLCIDFKIVNEDEHSDRWNAVAGAWCIRFQMVLVEEEK